MATESPSIEDLTLKLEQQCAETVRLQAECGRLKRLNEQVTREKGQLARENMQLAQQVLRLTEERDGALAYIDRNRHAPLWGLALGAGAASLFLGGGRRR